MNRYVRYVLAFSLICLLATSAYSQGYRPGFIVQASGDTIQGLIKYRENDRNYKSCVFKPELDAEAKEYLPQDIIAYGITNDALFESRDIIDEKDKASKVFVQALVHGRLNLYQYKKILFLQKDKDELKLLQIESEETSNGERATIRTSTKHLILINSLTFDCPVPENLMARVQKRINIPSVVAIVEAYNNCIQPNSNISYKEDKAWMATEKGVLVGSHSTMLNFNKGPYSIRDAKFPSANNVIIGGHFNFTSPRNSERMSLHMDVFYSQERHLGYLELQGPLILLRNDYTIEMKRISVLTMPRYTIMNSRRFSPYFGAGVSGNFIINGSGTRRLETETVIRETQQIETFISEVSLDKKFYLGATAAIGTNFQINDKHKALFQVRYEQGRYISGKRLNDPEFTAHLNHNHSLYITVAYIVK